MTDKELLERMMADNNTLSIGVVSNIFTTEMLNIPDTNSDIGMIKNMMGEDAWKLLMGSFTASFLCSIYVTASKNSQELNERIKEVENVFGGSIRASNICEGKADNA